MLTACVAYWAKPSHKAIPQKALARSTDRLESQEGLVVWINLRWYPLIVGLYCSGIAAVEGKRYDSLVNIFYTKVGSSDYRQRGEYFVEAVANGIAKLQQDKVFKLLPGYDKHYVPMSEYLFKTLQPKLDDLLFIGKSYESSFDEFEVLFALAVTDINKQRGGTLRSFGRFMWKYREHDKGPLSRIIGDARAMGENWEPIKAGLFGGMLDRFNAVADEYQQILSNMNWL